MFPEPSQFPASRTLSPSSSSTALPLGALMLAGSFAAWAQQTPGASLKEVTVRATAEAPEGQDALRATRTRIGKTEQDLRDVPQSITVVTEKLIDERNLDTLKDVLHQTAGITFQAAEGGEEDIRLRGFSLATTGDIFLDGMREPAFYERDTFNYDRVELLRGSASMLFGRGSTGGVVNQVSKQPRLIDETDVTTTLGSHQYRRVVGDINRIVGEDAAVRVTAMRTKADNNGAGSSIDKTGLAAGARLGIGTANEFSAGLYWLQNRNGINYGLPWIRPTASASVDQTRMLPGLDPTAYYGATSDRNNGGARITTLGYTHRFQDDSRWTTQLRHGGYERDLRASAIRFAGTAASATNPLFNPAAVGIDNLGPLTVLNRGNNNKVQYLTQTLLQSDYSTRVKAWGMDHQITTGVDYALEHFRFMNAIALVKPQTLFGTPDDGGGVNEDLRGFTLGRTFAARSLGAYAQDLVQLAPTWKLLGGLRYDRFEGNYWQAATGTADAVARARSDGLWSKRLGVLHQPSERLSFHASYSTSFNTSGDTYQYDPLGANTPPEGSRNLELGMSVESEDKRSTTRVALFHVTKTNERNRDPDSAAAAYLLSGKRHAAGIEVDWAGRITPALEVYASYAFTPIAKIDVGAPSTALALAGELQGQRPSLTPRHSGALWVTWQIDPFWRVGSGLNLRSSQTPNRNPGWSVPGYATVDLMAEYRIQPGMSVRANLINAANRYYADALYSGHYVPGVGRMLQVSLNAKF